ncbi:MULTISPECIES: DEAD/DEAH box helicase [unclassified Arcicella]|uniref:DEAD/DEAH box helicase n=1 Tax=unclassified Arcicella TaxID=2644986 RepID=UPI002865F5DA|nr:MULTISPECIES: DEAD/DEAH box helicase [unclassified Arcicella]MDR6564311.1 ATP-dependent RNA helicase RhlE [Arcicella sp. BE51]MDR6814062.1 ATP-dependent RNA helicase RhlE [Arcicella sp. BE140]MDR6825374.1 ATP-dependent RNA helicase RhlE [Arcicella sp. BE139]
MTFASLGLSASLLKGIEAKNYTEPFPIQEQAIPAILAGKDIQGIAQTGSGKTASFVLPILEMFQRKSPTRNLHLKVLILVPTRELAIQIKEVIDSFSLHLNNPVKNIAVFGGVPLNQQMVTLKNTEILVATPGRLLDLVSTQSINLAKIEILVLDEADKMLDLGFKEEANNIFKLLPKKRQNILFSATLDTDLEIIKESLLSEPVKIEIEPEVQNLDQIKQIAYLVSPERKGPLLRYLIKTQAMPQVLVFVSAVRTADNLVDKLKKNGINALAIHSKKTQGARTEALRNFKAGKTTVLVATDLASRGIDIEFLPFVINYELPRSPKDYVHRIGRTGRATASGDAISLICPEDQHHFHIIQKKMKRKVETVETADYDLGKF